MQIFKKRFTNLFSLAVISVVFLTNSNIVLAHVVVKPNQVGIGSFQTFTTGVPNEKELPVTGLKLLIPENLASVSPNVKPGWTVSIKKTGEGEEAKVTEISWTGGSIPAGQRDDFLFSAKSPSEAGIIVWKAYQTYQDGTVVAWDQDPNAPKPSMAPGDDDDHGMNPYSITKIVNDLVNPSTTEVAKKMDQDSSNTPMIFSVVALLLSCAAVGLALRKK
jgi:uncharacterized protein YcnI